MKKIPQIIAAVCSAAVCLVPASSIRTTTALKANAVPVTAGTSKAMSIPDSSINVKINKINSAHGGAISFTSNEWTPNKNGSSITYYKRGIKPSIELPWISSSHSLILRKSRLSFNISVPNNENTNTIDKIRNSFSIRVTYRKEGHSDGGTVLNNSRFNISLDPALSNYHTLTYNISLPISVYGDSFKAGIEFRSGNENTLINEKVTVSGLAMSDYDYGCSLCSAEMPGGETIHMNIDTQDIPKEVIEDYMRMLCRYINSLSELTNIHHKDIYVMFDERYVDCACCDHAIISPDYTTAVVMMPVNYNADSFMQTIRDGRLDWGLMHEISHCYAFTGYENEFAKAYNFSLDDVHTNVRAITAMQNCQQLRDTAIVKNGVYLGCYEEAMINAQPECDAEKGFYDIINVYGKYAAKIPGGWEILEDLFSGEYESPYLTNDVVYGALDGINMSENYRYGFDDGIHTPMLFLSADTYRFVNSMYYLCQNAGFDNYRFSTFISDFVGADEFAGFIYEKTNYSELGEANISHLAGDVDLDRETGPSDYECLTGYMKNTNGLSPEGAFNADIDKNGYIDQNDLNTIE